MRRDVKRGDLVLLVYGCGERRRVSRARVQGVGPKWITVEGGTRFQRGSGSGDFGWTLHTEATLDDADRRESALRTIHAALGLASVSTEALERAANALLSNESLRDERARREGGR